MRELTHFLQLHHVDEVTWSLSGPESFIPTMCGEAQRERGRDGSLRGAGGPELATGGKLWSLALGDGASQRSRWVTQRSVEGTESTLASGFLLGAGAAAGLQAGQGGCGGGPHPPGPQLPQLHQEKSGDLPGPARGLCTPFPQPQLPAAARGLHHRVRRSLPACGDLRPQGSGAAG